MTSAFKIPEELYHKYKGCGYAIASIKHGKITDFTYLKDVYSTFEQATLNDFIAVLEAGIFADAVEELAKSGLPLNGKISYYEFHLL